VQSIPNGTKTHDFGQEKFNISLIGKKLWCIPLRAITKSVITGAFFAMMHVSPAARFLQRMATDKELSDFLENVERRAYKQALYAVRKEESALDIVQDAMIKLAEKYGDKPASELPMLFQRILQTTILDYFRREKVRNTWVSLFSGMSSSADEHEDFDILETYEAEQGTEAAESSADKVERMQVLNAIDAEVQKLPARQREAFLMRYLHDLDVAETAEAMGCSEGSVKTHCSRATHALAEALKAQGIKL
jgi:RNA polymerase sigma-70 factor (ECF subfamily)